jgi:predicted ATPase
VITELRLERFKSFEDATLKLGPFTVVVGTNASGKSNVRDALRFLHGIGRGYTLPDIFGEKPGEGWEGIRGGTLEATFLGTPTFALRVALAVEAEGALHDVEYQIEVEAGRSGQQPRVVGERLAMMRDGQEVFGFDEYPPDYPLRRRLRVHRLGADLAKLEILPAETALSSLTDPGLRRSPDRIAGEGFAEAWKFAQPCLDALRSMRFLELAPDAMREPSVPGQTTLGDRGENLSSVLLAVCDAQKRKETLLSWVQELTPMDVADFEFVSDATGKVLVTLVERDGRKVSAHSASDGTLRFLGFLAALLGPERPRFYFFEELENGIHPVRLSLLTQLIEQSVRDRRVQVAGTTHSPQLLGLMSREALGDSSLVYRLPEHRESGIVSLLEVPTAREVLERHSIINLQESGWFENTMFFAQPDEDEEPARDRKEVGERRKPAADEAAA